MIATNCFDKEGEKQFYEALQELVSWTTSAERDKKLEKINLQNLTEAS